MFFSKNTEFLKIGIDVSMKQHMIIYKEACTVMSHRLIKLGKSFRYLIIKNGPDLGWISSLSTITRVSKFLVDATKVKPKKSFFKYLYCCDYFKNQKKGSALPLVIAVFNPVADTFLATSTEGESYYEAKSQYRR